ncbi:MAG: aldehyde dehydrogenase family protein, partial [Gammaproteobacteria bacterium]
MTSIAAPSASTLGFLGREHGHFIGGRWTAPASGGTLDVHDPATGERIARVAAGGAAEIDAAVRAARTAFEGPWSRVTAAQRSAVLWKVADLVQQDFQRLCELE